MRRATALHGAGCWLAWMGPRDACEKTAEQLSAEVESGAFDFDDAGHARSVATRAAERLRQMMADLDKIKDELRQAITPTDDRAVAA